MSSTYANEGLIKINAERDPNSQPHVCIVQRVSQRIFEKQGHLDMGLCVEGEQSLPLHERFRRLELNMLSLLRHGVRVWDLLPGEGFEKLEELSRK